MSSYGTLSTLKNLIRPSMQSKYISYQSEINSNQNWSHTHARTHTYMYKLYQMTYKTSKQQINKLHVWADVWMN